MQCRFLHSALLHRCACFLKRQGKCPTGLTSPTCPTAAIYPVARGSRLPLHLRNTHNFALLSPAPVLHAVAYILHKKRVVAKPHKKLQQPCFLCKFLFNIKKISKLYFI